MFQVEKTLVDGAHLKVLQRTHGIRHVRLARPDVRNAFDASLVGALTEAFSGIAEDVRLVVLDGLGSTFCAGADLSYMKTLAQASPAENLADARRLAGLFAAMASCPVPVVAWTHGAALGGGLGLVACADYAVAEAGTRFGTPEVRLGLVGATISPYLVRRMGVAQSQALLLSGRTLNSDEALRCGLVHEIVAARSEGDESHPDMARVLEMFLLAGPRASRATKELLLSLSPLPDGPLVERTVQAIAAARASDEGQAGLAAFFNRVRAPWAPAKETRV